MKKGSHMTILLIGLLLLFVLTACTDAQDPGLIGEPVDGGTVTDGTDPNAPKVIESKDITGFDANFVSSIRWRTATESRTEAFRFVVSPDADGVLTAAEEEYGFRAPADESLLTGLQEIIDRYGLVSMNGTYRVTAGLPWEYQASWLTVDYASGEKLWFTVNNEPFAEWTADVYDLFAAWFEAKGAGSLYPPKEDSPVTRLKLAYMENSREVSYGKIRVDDADAIDGQTEVLYREVYDHAAEQELDDIFILFPEDYLERVTEIFAGTDVLRQYDFSEFSFDTFNFGNHEAGYYGMSGGRPDYSEPDADGMALDIYLELENGRRFNIETKKASEIEGMKGLISELIEYHDSLF